MKLSRTICATFISLTAIIFVSQAHASMTYSVDDGIDDSHISVGGSGLLLNAFQTIPSGTSITALQIAFSNQSPTSSTFSILIFSDPNNDGSLLDGIEIFRQSFLTPPSIIPGSFVTFTLPSFVNLNVGDWFYAGVEETDNDELAISTDMLGGSFSWLALPAPDPTSATLIDTFANLSPIFARDLMIRVVAVPEISSSLFIALGLISGLTRRNRSR